MVTVMEAELYSVANAQQILDSLVHFGTHRPDDYFVLEMVSYTGGKEELHPTLAIRLDGQGQKTTLADQSAVLHCLADDGRLVSIVIGTPETREFTPARILVEQS